MDSMLLESPEMVSLAEEILGGGHTLRFRAPGQSMHPLIQDGDILEVQPWNGEALQRGQVILYRSAGNRLVAHRVVDMRQDEQGEIIFTGGYQARSTGLQPVRPKQVLGKVVRIERNGRTRRVNSASHRIFSALWALLAKTRSRFL
ncbi:MAG: S24/S26 family peptidase [Anaerolineales bacterium]|nr:S24/S26 family peptidase [Anaerolineales bacterium]